MFDRRKFKVENDFFVKASTGEGELLVEPCAAFPLGVQWHLQRKQIKAGIRIELVHVNDIDTKLQPGDIGTVDHVDDIGQIHILWDKGSRFALIPGEDSFRIIQTPQSSPIS